MYSSAEPSLPKRARRTLACLLFFVFDTRGRHPGEKNRVNSNRAGQSGVG